MRDVNVNTSAVRNEEENHIIVITIIIDFGCDTFTTFTTKVFET